LVYLAAGAVSRWPATSHVQADASKPLTDVCRPKRQDYRRRTMAFFTFEMPDGFTAHTYL
jgi:hypothetical protein